MKKVLQLLLAIAALMFVVGGTDAYSKVNISFGIGGYPYRYGYYNSYYPYSYGYYPYSYYPRTYYYSNYYWPSYGYYGGYKWGGHRWHGGHHYRHYR